MRAIFILIISPLWIGVASLVLAQSTPQEETKPTDTKTHITNPKENHPDSTVTSIIYFPTNHQTDDPNQHPTPNHSESWATWTIVIFTLALVVVGSLQWWTYRAIHNSTKVIERAYVKMSHHPPGLNIDPSTGQCSVTIQVKNFGRTPTTVTHVLLTHQLLPRHERLPQSPDYQRGGKQEPVQAFLVTNDEFFHPYTFTISTASAPSVLNGTEKLYVFGYVDYIDKFKKRHRGGYARCYDPQTHDLVFVTQPSYNYDRPRKKGEGNNWKE